MFTIKPTFLAAAASLRECSGWMAVSQLMSQLIDFGFGAPVDRDGNVIDSSSKSFVAENDAHTEATQALRVEDDEISILYYHLDSAGILQNLHIGWLAAH